MTMPRQFPLVLAMIVALPLAGCETLADIVTFGSEDPILQGERIPIMAA